MAARGEIRRWATTATDAASTEYLQKPHMNRPAPPERGREKVVGEEGGERSKGDKN